MVIKWLKRETKVKQLGVGKVKHNIYLIIYLFVYLSNLFID